MMKFKMPSLGKVATKPNKLKKLVVGSCSDHQNEVISEMLASDSPIVNFIGEGGCVDAETEILTKNDGWKKITDFNHNDIVVISDIESNLSYCSSVGYLEYEGKFKAYKFTKDKNPIDMVLTEEHRMALAKSSKSRELSISTVNDIIDTVNFNNSVKASIGTLYIPSIILYNNNSIGDTVYTVDHIDVSKKGLHKNVKEITITNKYCLSTPTGLWLARRNGYVFITGNSGKSYSTIELIKYLFDKNKRIAITATTHAAVEVLRSKLPEKILHVADEYPNRVTIGTIHSYLGMNLKPDMKGGETLVRIKGKDGKYKQPLVMDYLFIDEVSMLSTQLLQVLTTSKCVTTKTFLVGDSVQLTLPNTANLKRYPIFELKENMRQDDSKSDIRSYLKSLRELIESNSKSLPNLPNNSKNIHVYDDHCRFLKAYKDSSINNKVIITFTNATVKNYNVNIKKYIHKKEEEFSIGDIIIPTSPTVINDTVTIHNRQICTIEGIDESNDDYRVLHTDNGDIFVPRVKSVFDSYLQSLVYQKKWHEYYEMKGIFSRVLHRYAGTAHSLQGMTIEEVFIDNTDLMSILNNSDVNDYMRALYVAISRASCKVHIYNGKQRNYKCLGDYTPRHMKD